MQEIINLLNKKFKRNEEVGFNVLFKKPTQVELEILTDLYKTYSTSSNVYNIEELEVLKKYTTPMKILDFYNKCTPVDVVDIGADVNLLSLENIKKENSELAPGAYLIKDGLVTFASTTGGNAICMDLNDLQNGEPGIIIVDHSIFSNKKVLIFRSGVMEKYDLDYEIIKRYSAKISDTFSNFLKKVIGNEIDDIEDYLD